MTEKVSGFGFVARPTFRKEEFCFFNSCRLPFEFYNALADLHVGTNTLHTVPPVEPQALALKVIIGGR